MHQVHTERETGNLLDQLRRLGLRDAGEEEEGTETGTKYTRRAECPSPFHGRNLVALSRYSFDPESPGREDGA